jgi:hypothetical protein
MPTACQWWCGTGSEVQSEGNDPFIQTNKGPKMGPSLFAPGTGLDGESDLDRDVPRDLALIAQLA